MLSTCCVPDAMLQWIRQLEFLSLKCLPSRSRADIPIKKWGVQCASTAIMQRKQHIYKAQECELHEGRNVCPLCSQLYFSTSHCLNGYLLKRNESKPLFPKHHSVNLQSREGLGTEKYARDEQAGTSWSHKARKWCLLPWEALQLVQEEMLSNW